MKKLINWTFGGFFRTFGRILCYLLIGGLLFFIFSKLNLKGIIIPTLNASPNNNNVITLNYTDNFIINNKNNDYFTENGILEQIKSYLISNDSNLNNAKYLIGFTKNDIIVFVDYDINSEFYMFTEVYNTFDRILINSNTKSGLQSSSDTAYYYELSRFSSLSSFLSAIINRNNPKEAYNYRDYYRLAITTNKDLRNTSYNWFSYNNNYFIPYYSNTNIKNNCYGSGCDYSDIQNIPFSINGIKDYIPSYNNLFGYRIPVSNMTPYYLKLFSNSFTILPEDINKTWSYAISFRLPDTNYPTLNGTNVNVYGLVNNNGVYHYELINDKISVNLRDFLCNHNYCDIGIYNTDLSISGNINQYEKIYFDVVYNKPVNLVPASFHGISNYPYIINKYVNDVCSGCLLVQLESTGSNTYTFSNGSNNSNVSFYYNNLLANDIVYNMPSFIDFNSNSLIDAVNYTSNNYYYGVFNRVLFNNYQLYDSIGLSMNLYMNNVDDIYNISGSYQLLYYISPNIYWSDSVYTSDKDNISGGYVDSSGTYHQFSVNGDFHNYYSEHTNVESYFNILKGIMSDDMYGLSGLINTPLNKMRELSSKVCSPVSLPIPFTNTSINLPCMSSIYNTYVPQLINIWHIVLYGIVCYYVGVGIFRDIKNTLEADKNDIEVIEL